VSRNNRLQHLEERIGKLQSLCEKVGLLATEAPHTKLGTHSQQSNAANPLPLGDNGLQSGHRTALSGVMVRGGEISGTAEEEDIYLEASSTGQSSTVDAFNEDVGACWHQAYDLWPDYDPFANTSAASKHVDGEISISMPLESLDGLAQTNVVGHSQILAMIFADTSETRLLSELGAMTMMSAPIQLPPRDATYAALTNYFRNMCGIIPTYDEASTFHLVELFYDSMTLPSPDLSAYVYSVIALSCACNTQTISSSTALCEDISWDLFSQAAQYIPQLLSSAPGLLSTQALLGMVSRSDKLSTLG
jgi:hypothetical protein